MNEPKTLFGPNPSPVALQEEVAEHYPGKFVVVDTTYGDRGWVLRVISVYNDREIAREEAMVPPVGLLYRVMPMPAYDELGIADWAQVSAPAP